MEIWSLMKVLEDRVDDMFGDRLVCLGLQGSYARGEATEESDFDAVLILDTVTMSDIQSYREILRWLPHRDKVCGFVSGRDELVNWDRAGLIQFCMDTKVIRGSVDFARKLIRPEDIRRAVHVGACNLYHGAMYAAMHQRSMGSLAELYKMLFFVMRSYLYAQNGLYINSQREIAECLTGLPRRVMNDANAYKNGEETDDFDTLIERLLLLSSDLIRKFGGTE